MDMIEDRNKKGVSVIFSTHIMEEAEKIADRVLLIHKGKAAEYGELKEVKDKYSEGKFFVETKDKITSTDDFTAKNVKEGYILDL